MKLKKVDLLSINAYSKNTMLEVLGMECIEISDESLVFSMPVDKRTHQAHGLLHGGASAALIETVGSIGSSLLIDLQKESPVGLEVNANHIGGVKNGMVKAVGKIVHAGKKTHVWQVDIYDMSNDKHVCTGRLTVMIVPNN